MSAARRSSEVHRQGKNREIRGDTGTGYETPKLCETLAARKIVSEFRSLSPYSPSAATDSAASSLPRGTSGAAIVGTSESGIDVFQSYNSSAANFTSLDSSVPHVVFTPKW